MSQTTTVQNEKKRNQFLAHVWPAGLLALAVASFGLNFEDRLTRVESQVQYKNESYDQQFKEVKDKLDKMDTKMDKLINFQNNAKHH